LSKHFLSTKALFKWNKIDNILNQYPGPRKNASMLVTGNKIFFFGGSNEKMQFNDLICYDLGLFLFKPEPDHI